MRGWIFYANYTNIKDYELYEIKRLVEEAKKENIKVKVIHPEQIDIIINKNRNKSIFLNGKATQPPDFVISRLGAHTNYHTLAVLRNFERLGVYTLNSSQAIQLSKDKLFTHQTLLQHKILTPKTMFLHTPINIDLVKQHFEFPLILKNLSGSSGSGVFLVKNEKIFKDLISLLESSHNIPHIIIQEFIASSQGNDLRVLVIGNKVMACMLRMAGKNEFKANFSCGAAVCAFPITANIKNLVLKTCDVMNLEYAGIDLLFGKEGYCVCEANSASGFQGLESCCDINVPQEIYKYIKNKLSEKFA